MQMGPDGGAAPDTETLQERRIIPAYTGAIITTAGALFLPGSRMNDPTTLVLVLVLVYGVLMLFRALARPYRLDIDETGIHVRDGLRYLVSGQPETVTWEEAEGAWLLIRRQRSSRNGIRIRTNAVLRRRPEAEGRRDIVLSGSYRTAGMLSGAGATVDLLAERIRSMRQRKGLEQVVSQAASIGAEGTEPEVLGGLEDSRTRQLLVIFGVTAALIAYSLIRG